MPTLLLQDGFKFFFCANEHDPKHVNVAKGDDYAKIELDTFVPRSNHMKPKDLKKALAIVQLTTTSSRYAGMTGKAKGKAVHFDDRHLHVELQDGRMISTPMQWYPELQMATLRQVGNYSFICQNTGIEWPDLDYHLSIESMLAYTEDRAVV